MNRARFLMVLLLVPGIGYGMEADGDQLRALEEGSLSFAHDLSSLREMGLIKDGEKDIDAQLAHLTEAQRTRLLSRRKIRCAATGGGFWANFFGHGSNHHEQESLFLLRDLHRIALEEQRAAQSRTEELEKISRRFKIILVVVGTGLLGSLGTNGGFLANLLSSGADAASNL